MTLLISLVAVFVLFVQDEYYNIPKEVKNNSVSHPSWAYDVEDQVKLADSSKYIFIGTIEKIKGTRQDKQIKKLVATDAVVRVITNLKGDISKKRVYVSQYGGYEKETDSIVTMAGDSLYKEGETYVFFTSNNDDEFIYTIGALPYGKIKLDTPKEIASKIKSVNIKGSKEDIIVSNDYDIGLDTINYFTQNEKVKKIKENIKTANANPGISLK